MNYSENFSSRQAYLKHLLGALEGLQNSSTSNGDEVAGSNHNGKLAVDVVSTSVRLLLGQAEIMVYCYADFLALRDGIL